MRHNHHVWKMIEERVFDFGDAETRILHNAKFDVDIVANPKAMSKVFNSSRQMGKIASFGHGMSSTGRIHQTKPSWKSDALLPKPLGTMVTSTSTPWKASYSQMLGRTARFLGDTPLNLEPGHANNKVWECEECSLKVRAPYEPPPIDDKIRGYVPAKYVLMPLPGYERFPSCFSRIVRRVLED